MEKYILQGGFARSYQYIFWAGSVLNIQYAQNFLLMASVRQYKAGEFATVYYGKPLFNALIN